MLSKMDIFHNKLDQIFAEFQAFQKDEPPDPKPIAHDSLSLNAPKTPPWKPPEAPGDKPDGEPDSKLLLGNPGLLTVHDQTRHLMTVSAAGKFTYASSVTDVTIYNTSTF